MNRLKIFFVFLLLYVVPTPAQAASEPAVRAVAAARPMQPSDDDSREAPFVTRLRARAVPPPDLTRPERSPNQSSAAPARTEGIDFDHQVPEIAPMDRGVPVVPRTAERLPYDATAPPLKP